MKHRRRKITGINLETIKLVIKKKTVRMKLVTIKLMVTKLVTIKLVVMKLVTIKLVVTKLVTIKLVVTKLKVIKLVADKNTIGVMELVMATLFTWKYLVRILCIYTV